MRTYGSSGLLIGLHGVAGGGAGVQVEVLEDVFVQRAWAGGEPRLELDLGGRC